MDDAPELEIAARTSEFAADVVIVGSAIFVPVEVAFALNGGEPDVYP